MDTLQEHETDDVVAIYTLVDPVDDRIFYVGKTIHPIARWHEHIRRPSTKQLDVNKRLAESSQVFKMHIVDIVHRSVWREAEVTWNLKLRREHDLLNTTLGGDGLEGGKVSLAEIVRAFDVPWIIDKRDPTKQVYVESIPDIVSILGSLRASKSLKGKESVIKQLFTELDSEQRKTLASFLKSVIEL